ncbi:unnamed protein product [Linum tenue]|uniref:FF domain-containing protein n=1 Tax=Linum tenue TaxID=586396 RepID=A0AAV0LC51_9ROSI|nr:unnamed protein product [Linum tenue]
MITCQIRPQIQRKTMGQQRRSALYNLRHVVFFSHMDSAIYRESGKQNCMSLILQALVTDAAIEVIIYFYLFVMDMRCSRKEGWHHSQNGRRSCQRLCLIHVLSCSVRFQAIPSHSGRRSLFDYYVKTRAEEERKEKRAAQKAAVEGFKQLLEEASKDIDKYTDYQTFRKKWGNDPRFEALDRKDREHLLNERILSLRKAAREKAQAELSAVAVVFKSMLRERGDITVHSRWSRVKDSLRDDLRYTSTKHEDREALFNEYLSDLKAADKEAERGIKSKREEQVIVISSSTTLSQFLCLRERLKERERELRKRKEREELKMERVRQKVRRKEATSSFQALLVETIKDPQVYLIAMVAV